MREEKEKLIFDLKKFRILIVEDNKVNQLLVQKMLRNFGFAKFDCAESGVVALDKLKKNKFDLILMDIQMPEMNGYEITREIRNKLPSSIREIPIIALTANASEKERKHAREAGMDDFIVKPYSPEELFEAIHSQITESFSGQSKFMIEFGGRNKKQGSIAIQALKKHTGGDKKLEIELIEIFLKQISEANQKMEDFHPPLDWEKIYHTAHKLKGSVTIFEFAEMKKILQRIEDYSDEKINSDEVLLLFNKMKELSRSAVAELDIRLKKLKKENADQ